MVTLKLLLYSRKWILNLKEFYYLDAISSYPYEAMQNLRNKKFSWIKVKNETVFSVTMLFLALAGMLLLLSPHFVLKLLHIN